MNVKNLIECKIKIKILSFKKLLFAFICYECVEIE